MVALASELSEAGCDDSSERGFLLLRPCPTQPLPSAVRGAGARSGAQEDGLVRIGMDQSRLDAVDQNKINLPRQDPQPQPEHDQRAEPRELALLAPPSHYRADDALAIIDMGRGGGEEALRQN